MAGFALLERAIAYTLGSLALVTPDALPRPTPCRAWDLRTLLAHLNDSFEAMLEAARLGQVSPEMSKEDYVEGNSPDPVAALRDRAQLLLGAWTRTPDTGVVAISDRDLTAGVVACTGAFEIAVHGWDIARSCGRDRPIPAPLAEELRALVPFFVTAADRPARFAAPIAVPPFAGHSARLLSYLGRTP